MIRAFAGRSNMVKVSPVEVGRPKASAAKPATPQHGQRGITRSTTGPAPVFSNIVADLPQSIAMHNATVNPTRIAFFHSSAVRPLSCPADHMAHARELRAGRAEMRHTLCNPCDGHRLRNSLLWLLLYVLVLGLALFGLGSGICALSSHMNDLEFLAHACNRTADLPMHEDDPAVDLKPQLLIIQIPMFASLAFCYIFGVQTAVHLRPSRCFVYALVIIEFVLALTGAVIVATADALWVWGEEGEIGFAGVWIFIMNACGICLLVLQIFWGAAKDRRLRSCCGATLFATLLLFAVSSVQAAFYVVGWLRGLSLHPVLGTLVLLCLAKLIEVGLKGSFHVVAELPPPMCAYVTFCFQVGAYLSLRLYLQRDTDLTTTLVVSATAALLEIAMRLSSGLAGKLLYNHMVRKGNPERALRILDIAILDVVTDILAEIAAIVVAAALTLFANMYLFVEVAIPDTTQVVISMVCQLGFELVGDVLAIIIIMAVLPISFEGFFEMIGQVMLVLSFVGATLTYSMGILNLRFNMDCFAKYP